MDELNAFYVMSDLDAADDRLTRAVGEVCCTDDVRIAESWGGADKRTGEPAVIASKSTTIEWLRRGGRFGLDIAVTTPAAALTKVQFARRLSRAIGAPLLFSDCHIAPWSMFMSDADGAIWHITLRANDGDDFDLPAAADPEYVAPVLVVASDADLPPPGSRRRIDPPDWCEAFQSVCPKPVHKCPRVWPAN